MNSFIEFKNVRKDYHVGDTVITAVNNVDFKVNEGEFVVILGPSGAGKSTILNLLGGMDGATKGEIWIDGVDITKLSDKKLTQYRGTDIGFVFQFYNLISGLTVLENVAVVKEVSKEPFEPEKMLALVGLDQRMNQFPTQISGGEQQRVSIARAVCKNPKLLLCDEPTGALDSETGVKVLELLYELCHTYKKTVIVVTHNAAIAEVADKVIRFKDGKVKDVTIHDCPKQINEVVW